jgi:hypothetical protein
MKVLLPKIAVSVKDLIVEYKKLTEKNTDTDDKIKPNSNESFKRALIFIC